jgi:hypothetical protein
MAVGGLLTVVNDTTNKMCLRMVRTSVIGSNQFFTGTVHVTDALGAHSLHSFVSARFLQPQYASHNTRSTCWYVVGKIVEHSFR